MIEMKEAVMDGAVSWRGNERDCHMALWGRLTLMTGILRRTDMPSIL